MTKEQLLKDLQEEWNTCDEDYVTKEYYTDAIVIFVDENCDELTTLDDDGKEILCVDWVLNHFNCNKP